MIIAKHRNGGLGDVHAHLPEGVPELPRACDAPHDRMSTPCPFELCDGIGLRRRRGDRRRAALPLPRRSASAAPRRARLLGA